MFKENAGMWTGKIFTALLLLAVGGQLFFLGSQNGLFERSGVLRVELYGYSAAISKLYNESERLLRPLEEVQRQLEVNGLSNNPAFLGDKFEYPQNLRDIGTIDGAFNAAARPAAYRGTFVNGNNDLGYAVFSFLAFLLFGLSITSIAYMFYAMLAVTLTLYTINILFSSKNRIEACVPFIFLLAYGFSVSALGNWYIEDLPAPHAQRAIASLGLLPATHIIFFLLSDRSDRVGVVTAMLQFFFLLFVCYIRSTAYMYVYMIAAIAVFLIAKEAKACDDLKGSLQRWFAPLLVRARSMWQLQGVKQTGAYLLESISSAKPFARMSIFLFAAFLLFKGLVAVTLPSSEIHGQHHVWHNLILSLGYDHKAREVLGIPRTVSGDAFADEAVKNHIRKRGYDIQVEPFWYASEGGSHQPLGSFALQEQMAREVFLAYILEEPLSLQRSFFAKVRQTYNHTASWAAAVGFSVGLYSLLGMVIFSSAWMVGRGGADRYEWQTIVSDFTPFVGVCLAAFIPHLVFYPAPFLMLDLFNATIMLIAATMVIIFVKLKSLAGVYD